MFFLVIESWECRFDEFECPIYQNNSKHCVPVLRRCDGRNDCLGGEDERLCHARDDTQCGNNEFYCREQSTCIPASWKCDGHVDCLGDEDEKLCGKYNFFTNRH